MSSDAVVRNFRRSAMIFWAATVPWLAGCATQPPRPVLLPLPARPTLTPVMAPDLQCLSDSAYTTIVNRERGYKTWGLELEAIIQANNRKAEKP